MFVLEEELKKLPSSPGVYLMHGEKDEIIYIGKAISLKNRVRQYFQKSTNKTAKIEKMVSHIQRFEYIITDSELEALVLECNLIKEYRPRYNTMLKDDKTYPYIKVTVSQDFPRILFSRQMKKDKAKYYGPYTSAGAVKDTIELLQKIYKIRTCNRNLSKDIGKERPCLNYQIKKCNAPCQGYISKEEYAKNLQGALDFLNGNYQPIMKDLETKMLQASEELRFEEAKEYRDLLNSVKQVAQKQKITSFGSEDRDIIGLAVDHWDAVVQIFFIRDGKLIGREHFHLSIAEQDTREQILSSFLKQYYAGTPLLPKEIFLPGDTGEAELISDWLSKRRGQKVWLKSPKKGDKERLVELANRNAQLILQKDKEKMNREEKRTIGAVKEIAVLIGLEHIGRMEAFDISNTNGYESVGSMIVYEQGKPKRNDYRKFKIKTVKGPDDYASMEEVLTRRFTHGLQERQELLEKGMGEEFGSFSKFPDVLMMDGGKGQVHIAQKVLEALGIDIPVCGMVKDDKHRTRGLYYQDKEIPIDIHSEGFRLITRIQDEAHRFAIEYHRSLRGKQQVHSILDDIPGIGPARRKELLRHFRSLEKIQAATIEELKSLPSMNEAAAIQVYNFFHKN